MASFGQVLDLFNDRYLNLQDVIGNTEPFPSLVPYAEYEEGVIAYHIDLNHDMFFLTVQEFTARKSWETGKELWTWCVQWDVDDTPADISTLSIHTPKKARHEQSKPTFDTIERRVLNPALMRDEELLRIMIDIVQVESALIPNFIEFLYRWIDFYEGDGSALKAALRWEIPSLWDFEYHPLALAPELKKDLDEMYDTGFLVRTNNRALSQTELLLQCSPTKCLREKPDLAALERKAEASERLLYREVKYGIQPPQLDDALPPLVNVPTEPGERNKYYAACFRSRQRALAVLLEAGVTMTQAANYTKSQTELARDTPVDLTEEGVKGLSHYNNDARHAQSRFYRREREMALRKKQTEVSISNRLAIEAQLASRLAKAEGQAGVPLIPHTPVDVRSPNRRWPCANPKKSPQQGESLRISIVPRSLVGRMNSKVFEGAEDKDGGHWQPPPASFMQHIQRPPLPLPISVQSTTAHVESIRNLADAFHAAIMGLASPPGVARVVDPEHDLHSGSSMGEALHGMVQSQPPTIVVQSPSDGFHASTGPLTSPLPQESPAIPVSLLGGSASFPDPQGLSTATVDPASLMPIQPPAARPPPLPGILQGEGSHAPQANFPNSLAPTPVRLNRNAPPRLTLAPSPKPTAPLAKANQSMSIAIHFPGVMVPGNRIGPDGLQLGNSNATETDAFLLGLCQPGSGKIVISRAIFLPIGVFDSILRRVRKGAFKALETYLAPAVHLSRVLPRPTLPTMAAPIDHDTPHYRIYQKLAQVYALMTSSTDRERDVTKRWRVTKGPMTQFDRGSVWEGWGFTLDAPIELGAGERDGAYVHSGMIDHGVGEKHRSSFEEWRKREIDAMLEEDEAGEDSDVDMEG